MRTLLSYLSVLIIAAFSFCPVKAQAGAAAGGEIFYEWLSDSTYKFFFKYYRDCTGVAEPLTQPLCFYNTCSNTSFSVNMAQYQSFPAPQVNSCGYKTKCDSPASTISAYATVWYYTIVTMPSQCSEWKIFTYMSSRVDAANLFNSTLTDMYIEATLNNTGNFQGDSSPYFSVSSAAYSCANTQFSYNAGAVDPDGDSLVTEIIQPRTGVTSCGNTPINASFASTTPAYNTALNPIQTNNTFTLNAHTGQMLMVPSVTGTSTLAIKVKEYRHDTLIGSVMREMPVNIMACNAPVINANVGCENNIAFTQPGFQGTACVTLPFSFCINVNSPDPNAKIMVSDNHAVAMPGSGMNITGQNTDSIKMNFSWTPGVNDGGNKSLEVSITDNSCYYPGIPKTSTFHIPIYVNPPTKTINDTILCSPQPITLSVVNGGYFTWEIITANGTTTAIGPVIADTPSVNTRYIVTSNLTSYCPLSKDTADVIVATVKNPVVNILAMPDTVIGLGQQVIFGIANTDCNTPVYQWQLNGADIPGADSSTWVCDTLNNMDMVSCRMVCNDTCAKDTTSNVLTIHIANHVDDLHHLSGIEIYPNPNNGAFTLKGYAAKLGDIELKVTNIVGQELYAEHFHVNAGSFKKAVYVEGLPDGIYLLGVESQHENTVRKFHVAR